MIPGPKPSHGKNILIMWPIPFPMSISRVARRGFFVQKDIDPLSLLMHFHLTSALGMAQGRLASRDHSAIYTPWYLYSLGNFCIYPYADNSPLVLSRLQHSQNLWFQTRDFAQPAFTRLPGIH